MSLQYGDRVRHAYLGDITSQQWSQLSEIGIGTLVFQRTTHTARSGENLLNLYRMLASGDYEQIVDTGAYDYINQVKTQLEGQMSSMFKYMGDIRNQDDLDDLTGLKVGYGYRIAVAGDYEFIKIGDQEADERHLDAGDMLVVMEVGQTATPTDSKFNINEANIDQTTLLLKSMVNTVQSIGDNTISTDLANNRYYAVHLYNDHLFVNIPWIEYSAGTVAELSDSGTSSRVWTGKMLNDNFLRKTGGAMSGNIILGTNSILEQSNANLIGFSSGDILIGNSGRGITFESENADLYHKISTTSYKIWDAHNLPTTDLILRDSTLDAFLLTKDIVPDLDSQSSALSVNIGSEQRPINSVYVTTGRFDDIRPATSGANIGGTGSGQQFDNAYITTVHAGTLYEGITPLSQKYLLLSGGSMSNTNLVTNMNADLLDSKHLTEIMADVAASNVATATNLKVVEEKDAMFTYRNTPTAAKVAGDVVRVEEIRGNSIAWNNKIVNGDFANADNWEVVRGTISISDNECQLVCDDLYARLSQRRTLIDGHKYYYSIEVKSPDYNNFSLFLYSSGTAHSDVTFTGVTNSYKKFSTLITPSGYTPVDIQVVRQNSATSNTSYYIKNVVFIDLTEMFGSEIANAMTVDKFEALYPGFHGFNPGAIKNLSIEAFKSVGFNKWDEQWEVGVIASETGLNAETSTQIRSKNYIRISGGVDYYLYNSRSGCHAFFYDANLQPLADNVPGSISHEGYRNGINSGSVFTTPAEACYMRFFCFLAYGVVYQNDICINLSDPTRNGTYEPYKEDVVELNIGGGFNRFNEKLYNGLINADDTINTGSSIKHSDYIVAQPNTKYYINKGVNSQHAVFFYNASKTLLSYTLSNTPDGGEFTTPVGTAYIRINVHPDNFGKVCLNISDPTRNGTYKPYKVITGKNTASLNPVSEEIFVDGMKGINGVCDSLRKYDADVVMAEVDLGSLSWTYDSSSTRFYTDVFIGTQTSLNILCSKYPSVNVVTTSGSGIVIYSGRIFIRDTNYTDAATFKTSLNGVYAVYKLATPKHYILDEPLDLTAHSDALGTQSIVPSQTGMSEPTSAPIVADLKYGASAFDLMEAGGSYEEGTSMDVSEQTVTPKVWSGKTLHDEFLTRDDYMLNNIAQWDQSAGGELGLLYFYSDVQVGSDQYGERELSVLGKIKEGRDDGHGHNWQTYYLEDLYLGLHAKADSAGDADYLVSGSNKYNVAAFARKAEYPFLFDNIKNGDSDSNPAFDSDLYVGLPAAGSTEHDLIVSGKVKEGGSWLEDKYAAINGNIATATNLKTYTETGAMFTHRAIPAEGQHGSDMAQMRLLRGKSIVWNQLIGIPTSSYSKTESGVTIVDNRDGSYTISTEQSGASADVNLGFNPSFTSGHTYYLSGCPSGGSLTTYYIGMRLQSGGDIGSGFVFTTTESGVNNWPRIIIKSGTVIATPITFRPQLIDLTALTMPDLTAPAFAALYPGFHGFNSGTIKNFAASGLLSDGFNQWDEQWVLGYYGISSGAYNSAINQICSKSYIPCFPNTQYYRAGGPSGAYVIFYDSNKNKVGAAQTNRLFTTPSQAAYMTLSLTADYGTTYKNDICINRSSARNGQYEPYRSYTTSWPITTMTGKAGGVGNSVVIYPDGMMAAGTAFDFGRVDDDGWWRRTQNVMKMVNLGDLTWIYSTTTHRFYSDTLAPIIKKISGSVVINALCDRYMADSNNNTYGNVNDKAMSVSDAGIFFIYDTGAGTDADTFKSAMDGVYAVVELATPVEYVLDTPIYMGYPVDADGTETMLPDQTGLSTPTSAPLCCDIQYGMTQSDIFSASRYLEGTAADIANQTAQAMVWSGDTLADTFFLKSHLAYVAPSGSTKGYLATEQNVLYKENGTLLEDKYLQTQYLTYVAAAGNVAAHLSTSLPLWTSSTLRFNGASNSYIDLYYGEVGQDAQQDPIYGLVINGDAYADDIYVENGVHVDTGSVYAGTVYEGGHALSQTYLTIQDNRWITSL